MKIYEKNGLYFIESDYYNIIAYGKTEAEAIIEFTIHLANNYNYYKNLNEEDLIGLGKELKRRYSDKN